MSESPPNMFKFTIDVRGDETGQQFKGKFVYVRPDIGRRRDVDQLEDILNSEYKEKYQVKELTKTVKNYNYTIAYLKVCLEECPEWFTGSDYGLKLQDENVLDLIAYKIKTFENDRVKKIEEILAKPRTKIQTEEEKVDE